MSGYVKTFKEKNKKIISPCINDEKVKTTKLFGLRLKT